MPLDDLYKGLYKGHTSILKVQVISIDQKKEVGGEEAGFLTLRHVSHFTVRHDLLYDFKRQRTILEQTTNHCLETKCLLGLTG